MESLVVMQADELRRIIASELDTFFKSSKCPCNQNLSAQDSSVYLTRSEVCDFLHITPTTLWRYEKRGLLTAKKIGRRCLYCKRDVEAMVEGQAISQKASDIITV